MPTRKDKAIQKYLLDRISQIEDEVVNNDPQYREILERVFEWKQKIAERLPLEDRKLLEDYEGSWIGQVCRQEEILFKEGWTEGMMLGYWVAAISHGVEKIKV